MSTWMQGEVLDGRAGEPFDPKAADVEALADDVAALAKAWTRKPPARR